MAVREKCSEIRDSTLIPDILITEKHPAAKRWVHLVTSSSQIKGSDFMRPGTTEEPNTVQTFEWESKSIESRGRKISFRQRIEIIRARRNDIHFLQSMDQISAL
jgi:hypothetical protein